MDFYIYIYGIQVLVNFGVFLIGGSLKELSIVIGATFKGKMLPFCLSYVIRWLNFVEKKPVFELHWQNFIYNVHSK